MRFNGYPSRPFSITHPLRGDPCSRSVWFHVRRNKNGRVTSSLGKRIAPGHRVKLTGPYGSAHFRPNLEGRLILVATNTGFAPIWSIAVAALRENPERRMMIIAGGRTIESLYMGPRSHTAGPLPQCSRRACLQHTADCHHSGACRAVRPTICRACCQTDVLYACGAPAMVDAVKSIAALNGAVCYADPFLPTTDDKVEEGVLTRAKGWLAVPVQAPGGPTRSRSRPQPAGTADAGLPDSRSTE